MNPLDVSYKLLEQGQFLKITFSINSKRRGDPYTSEFKIDDMVQVRFKLEQDATRGRDSPCYGYGDGELALLVYMSYKKCDTVKDFAVKLNMKLNDFNYSEQLICPETWTEWIEVGKLPKLKSNSNLLLEVTMAVSKAEVITFAKLYNDTITTDIKVSTKGSKNPIQFHRSCLLTHSDFFKTLFQTGDFIDKKDFEIGEKDVTDQTIQHLKDYVYLGALPDDGLCSLLMLARCYLFENLKSECITKIVQTVTPEDLHRFMGFACENNMPELGIALLQTPHEVVHQAHVMSKVDRKRPHNEESEEPKKRKKIKK